MNFLPWSSGGGRAAGSSRRTQSRSTSSRIWYSIGHVYVQYCRRTGKCRLLAVVSGYIVDYVRLNVNVN
ncbi:hypothetical protein VTP01DRAFT_8164 [Rhizomucor pusillus]|uniref:uncharacterized protein n=1 Tax=Rhizomucor pusillus TaxID=4840 RepID=UPI003742E6A5